MELNSLLYNSSVWNKPSYFPIVRKSRSESLSWEELWRKKWKFVASKPRHRLRERRCLLSDLFVSSLKTSKKLSAVSPGNPSSTWSHFTHIKYWSILNMSPQFLGKTKKCRCFFWRENCIRDHSSQHLALLNLFHRAPHFLGSLGKFIAINFVFLRVWKLSWSQSVGTHLKLNLEKSQLGHIITSQYEALPATEAGVQTWHDGLKLNLQFTKQRNPRVSPENSYNTWSFSCWSP